MGGLAKSTHWLYLARRLSLFLCSVMSDLSPALLVAQLSDLHLFATPEQTLVGLKTGASFRQVLENLSSLNPRPDLILLTGDLAQDESSHAYQQLADYLSPLNIPCYWLPGNHDDPLLMASILSQPPIFADKDIQVGGWRFLLLDSTVPNAVHGAFSSEQLIALERSLQANQTPTVIALHHHPVTIDSAWLDNIGLHGSDAFRSLIGHYPQVKIVLFGHIHQETEHREQGTTYLSTPSTCVQFEPHQKNFAIDEQSYPGFRLIQLYANGTFDTQVQPVAINESLDTAAQGY